VPKTQNRASPGNSKPGAKNGHSEAIEIIDLGDLNPDDKNARTHTPRGVGMIAKAIQEVGAARSGVIDENRKVLAGNATLDALVQAGIRKVKVISANGDEWVVVKRTGLTAKEKKKLALYDNRTSELSMWDVDILKEFNDEQLLNDMFFDGELFNLGLTDIASDPNAQWRGMPSFSQEDQMAWKQVIVNFRCAEDLKKFAVLLKQTISEQTRSVWYPENERVKLVGKLIVSES
jgi:hypothetical protein